MTEKIKRTRRAVSLPLSLRAKSKILRGNLLTLTRELILLLCHPSIFFYRKMKGSFQLSIQISYIKPERFLITHSVANNNTAIISNPNQFHNKNSACIDTGLSVKLLEFCISVASEDKSVPS